MKTKETTLKPRATGRVDAALNGGREPKRKKGPGSWRKALIRLNPAKEIKGFSLL